MGTALQIEDREERLSRARAALGVAERSAARWGGRIDRTALQPSAPAIVIRTHTLQYALSVAGREGHAAGAGTGGTPPEGAEAPAVARASEQGEGTLAKKTLQRVAEDLVSGVEAQARPVRRPELPYELVERLVGLIGERLGWQIVGGRSMAVDEARAMLAAVRERAAISFTARGHADLKLQQRLKAQLNAGRLGHDELLGFLRTGEIAALEVGIGLRAGLEPGEVRRLLYHPDRRHLTALCLAAGFQTPHYVALRLALEVAEEAVAARPGGLSASRQEAVRSMERQYEALREEDEARRRASSDVGRSSLSLENA